MPTYKGTFKTSAVPGSGTGSYILSENVTVDASGISAGTSGLTAYEVQVFKIAWGASGEFKWADDSVVGTYAGPLPVQLLDSNGAAFRGSAIAGSDGKMLDVNLLNQGGSASTLRISSGTVHATGGHLVVAGTTSGGYVPVAGSTVGAAIPHIGGTTDVLGSLTFGVGGTTAAQGATGAFSGTISSKLRSIASDIHSIISGGTGSDGVSRARGISVGVQGHVPGVSASIVNVTGMTFAVGAIEGGITIGIASVQVDNPVVIGSDTAITGGTGGGSGYGGTQISTVSTTLKSGVRIKNTQGSTTLTVSYDTLAGSTTGMTSGWALDDREEVFIEVDSLKKVYVRSSGSATAYSYYAT